MLKPNIGTIDRTVRILAGIALLGLTWTGHIGAWGWLGLIALLTGIFRVCPAYLPFGISTCAVEKK